MLVAIIPAHLIFIFCGVLKNTFLSIKTFKGRKGQTQTIHFLWVIEDALSSGMFDIMVFKLTLTCLVLHFIQRDIRDVGKAVKYLLFKAEFILLLMKKISLVLITAVLLMGIILSVWMY